MPRVVRPSHPSLGGSKLDSPSGNPDSILAAIRRISQRTRARNYQASRRASGAYKASSNSNVQPNARPISARQAALCLVFLPQDGRWELRSTAL
jgi:hypothetical protein